MTATTAPVLLVGFLRAAEREAKAVDAPLSDAHLDALARALYPAAEELARLQGEAGTITRGVEALINRLRDDLAQARAENEALRAQGTTPTAPTPEYYPVAPVEMRAAEWERIAGERQQEIDRLRGEVSHAQTVAAGNKSAWDLAEEEARRHYRALVAAEHQREQAITETAKCAAERDAAREALADVTAAAAALTEALRPFARVSDAIPPDRADSDKVLSWAAGAVAVSFGDVRHARALLADLHPAVQDTARHAARSRALGPLLEAVVAYATQEKDAARHQAMLDAVDRAYTAGLLDEPEA